MSKMTMYSIDAEDLGRLGGVLAYIDEGDTEQAKRAVKYLIYRIKQGEMGEWDFDRQRLVDPTPHARRLLGEI